MIAQLRLAHVRHEIDRGVGWSKVCSNDAKPRELIGLDDKESLTAYGVAALSYASIVVGLVAVA